MRSLLASISLSYPVGTVMMLRSGSATVRFKRRAVQGATPPAKDAERLILDGQQRLTSLFQSLVRQSPVATRDQRGREIERWYYIDIREALNPDGDREEAVVSLPADRMSRTFHNEVLVDCSTAEREYEAMLFPLSKVFEADDWMMGFQEFWDYDKEKIQLWNNFNREVIKRFEQYQVPVIELGKDTPREAVCQVFEKVNTGGVTLTVFELLTATFAADEFDLRQDWEARHRELGKHSILAGFSNTDFLQVVTLLGSLERRNRAAHPGLDGERLPPIGCKRRDILRLALTEYETWAGPVVRGLEAAARFLHTQHLYDAKFLPYGGQLVPLAAILTVLDRDGETHGARDRIARWYWCGVFGELYGGTTETRFARDLPDVVGWIREGGPEPRTIADAIFAPGRLLSLRTRGSAAYKGIYALLLREGARDPRTGEATQVLDYFDERVDIHHIFPQKWCREHGIEPGRCDSVINKTPLTARTNRIIGGSAPSDYLRKLPGSAGMTDTDVDAHLTSHLIDSGLLRSDDFDGFFAHRQRMLLDRISGAMGKRIELEASDEPDEVPDDYEAIEEDSQTLDDAAVLAI